MNSEIVKLPNDRLGLFSTTSYLGDMWVYLPSGNLEFAIWYVSDVDGALSSTLKVTPIGPKMNTLWSCNLLNMPFSWKFDRKS